MWNGRDNVNLRKMFAYNEWKRRLAELKVGSWKLKFTMKTEKCDDIFD